MWICHLCLSIRVPDRHYFYWILRVIYNVEYTQLGGTRDQCLYAYHHDGGGLKISVDHQINFTKLQSTS